LSLFIRLCQGMLVSLEIFFLTLLFSLPLGMLVALGSMSGKKLIKKPIRIYILIMRGTPLILQLVFVLYAPFYLFGINLNRFTAAIIAFVLNYAAYMSEIYRAGIESIPIGQYEAASVLGFTKFQTFFRIVLPQVVKRILPPVSNEVITLIKDTALVQVVGISELFRVAQNEASRVFSTNPLFIAGIFYFVMNWLVTKVFHSMEERLSYYR